MKLAPRIGLFAAVLLAPSLVLACQDREDVLSDLEGTKWVLVDVAGQPALPSPPATLEFTKKGEFGGHTSCNHFGGKIRIDRGRLQVTDLVGTHIGCGPPIGVQEARYTKALVGAERFELEGNEMLIYSDAFEQPLRFRPAGE